LKVEFPKEQTWQKRSQNFIDKYGLCLLYISDCCYETTDTYWKVT